MNTRTFIKSIGIFSLWPFLPKSKILKLPEPQTLYGYTFRVTEVDKDGKWLRISVEANNDCLDRTLLEQDSSSHWTMITERKWDGVYEALRYKKV